MNLPYPFQDATDVKPNAHGSISLIDAKSKPLAKIPLTTALALSPEIEGYADDYGGGGGDGDGCGDGYGDCFGNGYRYGYGYGCGIGCYGDGQSNGSGGKK